MWLSTPNPLVPSEDINLKNSCHRLIYLLKNIVIVVLVELQLSIILLALQNGDKCWSVSPKDQDDVLKRSQPKDYLVYCPRGLKKPENIEEAEIK